MSTRTTETEIVTYTCRGLIERGTGGPGYAWHNGFSETTSDGRILYPWMTRSECVRDARSRGMKAKFLYAEIIK